MPQDRAARTADAIVQMIFRSSTPRDLLARIAAYLRDDYAELRHEILADLPLSTPENSPCPWPELAAPATPDPLTRGCEGTHSWLLVAKLFRHGG
jgi:hypothetical protein